MKKCIGNSGVENIKPHSIFEGLLHAHLKVDGLLWVELHYSTNQKIS